MIAVLLATLTFVDPATYVGNVYGTAPPNALISVGDRAGRADEHGRFLINSIPTPYDGADYTIVAGDKTFSIHVLPGASMAVELDATRDEWRYRHELQTANRELRAENFTRSVFATREGLVGGTTANGHVIVPNDHFVALPSRRALSTNFGHEREVRVSYKGRTTVQPVWDIGPWNTRDDYWNPPQIRETFRDLPRGRPEAEAAFLSGYNGGLDERGRVVRTPAGIDLADGVFRIDLALLDNDWVDVEYLWLDAEGPVVTDIGVQPGSLIAHVSDASPLDTAEVMIDGLPVDALIVGNVIAAPITPGTHTISVRARDVYGNWGTPLTMTVTAESPPPRRRAARH